MEESNSDWDSLPPEDQTKRADQIMELNGMDDERPPFDFRKEIEGVQSKRNVMMMKNRSLAQQKRNAYAVSSASAGGDDDDDDDDDEQPQSNELEGGEARRVRLSTRPPTISQVKSSELSQGTPTSQVTIVENKRNLRNQLALMNANTNRPLTTTAAAYRSKEEEEDYTGMIGLDNPAFDDHDISVQEKASRADSKELQGDDKFPASDERILLWQFEEPAESFLQISEDKTGFKSEAIGLNMVESCDHYLSECLGYFRIPFMLAILIAGHLILFVLRALCKPISDYIWKPLLVSFHNWICVPTCGLSHHFCVLCTHSVSPCLRMVSVLFCSGGRARRVKQLDMSPI